MGHDTMEKEKKIQENKKKAVLNNCVQDIPIGHRHNGHATCEIIFPRKINTTEIEQGLS